MIWRRLRHNWVLAPGPCEVLELRMPWAHEALGMGVARWRQLSLEIYSQNWISVSSRGTVDVKKYKFCLKCQQCHGSVVPVEADRCLAERCLPDSQLPFFTSQFWETEDTHPFWLKMMILLCDLYSTDNFRGWGLTVVTWSMAFPSVFRNDTYSVQSGTKPKLFQLVCQNLGPLWCLICNIFMHSTLCLVLV